MKKIIFLAAQTKSGCGICIARLRQTFQKTFSLLSGTALFLPIYLAFLYGNMPNIHSKGNPDPKSSFFLPKSKSQSSLTTLYFIIINVA